MRDFRNALPMSRRTLLTASAGLAGAAALGWPRRGFAAATPDMADWSKPVDIAAAKIEAANFTSYGMPDSWANYGEVLQKMAAKYDFKLSHVDTDMSSLEEITKFDAEKNNPVAISADIGILFGRVAEARGVVPDYMPPNAEKLPVGLKGAKGGWVATFTGVPAFVVNTDVVKTVPKTWQDLLDPQYKGKINAIDAGGSSGTDISVFIAWAYANGGSETDLKPGAEFARKMLGQFSSAASNAQTLERGEVPIQIKYDFNCIAAADQVRAKGVKAEVVIPKDSIYAPSALMINRFNLPKMNAAKLLLDFVLTDEAQTAFAKFGARPIRWVLGDLKLPEEARKGWLPDADYAGVHIVKNWAELDVAAIASVWQDMVQGG